MLPYPSTHTHMHTHTAHIPHTHTTHTTHTTHAYHTHTHHTQQDPSPPPEMRGGGDERGGGGHEGGGRGESEEWDSDTDDVEQTGLMLYNFDGQSRPFRSYGRGWGGGGGGGGETAAHLITPDMLAMPWTPLFRICTIVHHDILLDRLVHKSCLTNVHSQSY